MIAFQPVSAEETIARARRINELDGFVPVPEEEFLRLLATAPPWPDKPGCIRSLRLNPKRNKKCVLSYENSAAIMAAKKILGDQFSTAQVEYNWICQLEKVPIAEWIVLDLFVEKEFYRPEKIDREEQERRDRLMRVENQACLDGLIAGLWLLPEAFEEILRERETVTWQTGIYMEVGCGWGPTDGWLSISGRRLGAGTTKVPETTSGVPRHGYWLGEFNPWQDWKSDFVIKPINQMPPAP